MLPKKVPNLGSVVEAGQRLPSYLTEAQLNALTAGFQEWFDQAEGKRRKQRAKHWAIFLVLRFTGARLGEVLQIDDSKDIDWRRCEVVIPILKRKTKAKRTVFLPAQVVAEISQIIAEMPELRGSLFKVTDRAFRYTFKERALKVGIPADLAHPHVLRHTRAIELLRAGVPLTLVRTLLGHSSLNTTAIYLELTPEEARRILQERGLL